MPDYGHDLQFGIFPSPDAAAAERTLELAQLAEVSGLDLVSVQDHPYQARHLDTWTLLSVIAARTTAIRVSPNVANLPLRPPVVLARSAATLDLLSGGRVELGLGAGAFWDAIAAAGGPRRTPKEAVDALVEAIGIIREVWGTGTVRADGEHYQVNGLHAGPQPAHDIPIWIGSYKPRMLRVTADLADAWIPSMGYADPPALAEMNAAHRRRGRGQRARTAGDPADVQRLRPLRLRGGLPPGHRRSTGPSSSPGSRSTRASAPSSSAPTTPTTSAGSPSRSRPPCASRSTPSGSCAPRPTPAVEERAPASVSPSTRAHGPRSPR